MGEIRFVGTGETRGYPYPVCKKRMVGLGKTRGYPYPVCKKYYCIMGLRLGLILLFFFLCLSICLSFLNTYTVDSRYLDFGYLE